MNIPPAERSVPEAQVSGSGGVPGGGPVPGQAKLAWIVAEREITTRLRSKAFVISTAILVLGVLAAVVIGGIVQNRQADRAENPEAVAIAVVGEAPEALAAGAFEAQTASDRGEAQRLVESGEVEAAVLVENAAGEDAADSDAAGAGSGAGADPVPAAASLPVITVLAVDEAPDGLVESLTVAPQVELLDGSDDGFNMLAYLTAFGFGIVFYMTALTFGTTIAQSVVEEKQTRIVEILLATVSARTMMAGKILGNSLLALGNVAVILALAAIGLLATGQDLLLGELGASLIWFGVLFAFGFVLVATLYAATASMVSRQEDVGSATSPVMFLVMIPFFLVVFFFDNERVLSILSYVPFSAPVGMPMRLVLGTAEWWEPLLSLGVVLATIAVIVWVSARIYRNSILRTGARVSFKDAVSG